MIAELDKLAIWQYLYFVYHEKGDDTFLGIEMEWHMT